MIFKLEKTSGKARKILFHLIGWMIFFSLNHILLNTYQANFNPYLHLSTWGISIITFYISYSVLMPYLLFRKKILPFIISTMLLFASTISINHLLVNNIFREQIQQKMIEQRLQERNTREIAENSNLEQTKSEQSLEEKDSIDTIKGRRTGPPGRMNMLGIYSILLFFASGTTLSLIERWNKDQQNIREKERERILAELSYLKNQVNPHFLFNSLNSIYSLSIKKSDQTTQSIVMLSHLLRYMLYDTQSELVPIQKELEYIADYIELQKLRVSGKTQISYSLPEDYLPQYKIEPLLLIPVVENAFKYGVDNTKNSKIDIVIEVIEGKMIIRIENDIMIDMDSDRSDQSGIGLTNLRRRLEILYPNEHLLETNRENKLFTVHISLKLKS